MGLDFLAIVLSDISNNSDQRIFRIVSSQYSDLPPFLIENSGINSGYMIPQHISASLAANQEDYPSMGTSSALKLIKSISNTPKVLVIEITCGCQDLDHLTSLKPSRSLQLVYNLVREYVPILENDKILYKDIKFNRIHVIRKFNTRLFRKENG